MTSMWRLQSHFFHLHAVCQVVLQAGNVVKVLYEGRTMCGWWRIQWGNQPWRCSGINALDISWYDIWNWSHIGDAQFATLLRGRTINHEIWSSLHTSPFTARCPINPFLGIVIQRHHLRAVSSIAVGPCHVPSYFCIRLHWWEYNIYNAMMRTVICCDSRSNNSIMFIHFYGNDRIAAGVRIAGRFTIHPPWQDRKTWTMKDISSSPFKTGKVRKLFQKTCTW